MTFCPEWLMGNPNLDTSNALYLWVYLVVSVLATCFMMLLLLTIDVLSLTVVHEHDVSIRFRSEKLVSNYYCYQMGRGATLVDS